MNIERLKDIHEAVGIPLVLHGGTGIRKEYILDAIQNGIAKINVATAIRQPYEQALGEGLPAAQQAVYDAMRIVIRDDLEIENSAETLHTTD